MKFSFLMRCSFLLLLVGPLEIHAVKADEKQKNLAAEFAATCLTFGRDLEALSNSFEEGGWDDITKNPTPKIAALLKLSDEAIKTMPGNAGIDEVLVFEMKSGVKTFDAFVSLNHIDSRHSVGCQVYDFLGTDIDFPRTFPDQLSEATPDKKEQSDFKFFNWKHPNKLQGFINVKMAYFAPESKPAKISGISGIFMSSTARVEE
jgi:hypothetical protein